MTVRTAIATILGCIVLGAAVGTGIGYGLGTYAPCYYRTVFRGGMEPRFDPVTVGVGQGLTQGTAGGALVGLALVALFRWRDTRPRRDPRPVHDRPRVWAIGCGIALAVAVVSPFALFALILVSPSGSGCADEAARLTAVVERIADPEAGQGVDPDYAAKRFKDGEWVVGIGRDSHGPLSSFRGGGTLVLKDSRGRVRCFFGHVCGPRGHVPYMDMAHSLDEFYKKLLDGDIFTEYQLP
jgi:hypothetical protein